jgi:hypothetical protein
MQLVWALRNRDVTGVRDQLCEILAQRPEFVVISCEALSRLNPEQILQLRQLLGSAPVQIVYYVRRWPERLPSLWQEDVKFGHTATLPEFLTNQVTKYDVSELRDTVMIDRFAAVFDASQIKVVCYSHLTDQQHDIAGHFLSSFLGVSDVALPDAGRPNRSLSIFDTETIRILNEIHARRGGERSPALRNWFLNQKENLETDVILDAMRNSQETIRLDEAAPPFALVSRDLLTRYAPSVVPPRHTDGLHERRAIDVPFVRQDYLWEPAVPKILRDIFERYVRGI